MGRGCDTIYVYVSKGDWGWGFKHGAVQWQEALWLRRNLGEKEFEIDCSVCIHLHDKVLSHLFLQSFHHNHRVHSHWTELLSTPTSLFPLGSLYIGMAPSRWTVLHSIPSPMLSLWALCIRLHPLSASIHRVEKKAGGYSKALVLICKTTLHYIPEGNSFNIHCFENLRPQ
jgi:zinc transporter ZupT